MNVLPLPVKIYPFEIFVVYLTIQWCPLIVKSSAQTLTMVCFSFEMFNAICHIFAAWSGRPPVSTEPWALAAAAPQTGEGLPSRQDHDLRQASHGGDLHSPSLGELNSISVSDI